MSDRDIKPYLIAVAALFIASAAFLNSANNTRLIGDLYLKVTNLQDMDVKITDILIRMNDIIQDLTTEVVKIWDAIVDILEIIENSTPTMDTSNH